MKVEKIINNNIVSSRDDDGNELIIMGRGLGFGVKNGQYIDEGRIEKIFKLDNQDSMEHFKALLVRLPLEYVRVSNEIISYAEEALGQELNKNVYLTLTDHISFAIDRFKEGMLFNNALFEEVRMFYPNEYTVGCHALYLIEQRTGIRLIEDEAASIAIHIVNAELNSAISTTFTFMQMIRDMKEIIEREIPESLKDMANWDKLVINFKQLVHRMMMESPKQGKEDEELFCFVRKHCADEYRLIGEVNRFIREKYDCSMTEEERIYLTLNVKRIKDLL